MQASSAPGQKRSSLKAASKAMRHAVGAMAEHDYLHMSRLRRMRHDELRALLAGDPSKAALWIASAARHGLVEAQLRLGQMYLDGHGVDCDEGAALTWFCRAARQGSAEAMNMVGRCHEIGWGAATDLDAAARWYRASAHAGYDWGEYNYANALFDGRGVAMDRQAAVTWYRRAADQGHTRAMNLLARCHEEGWGTSCNSTLAREWYRRSAEGGYFRAQFNHATVLAAAGAIDEAIVWFEKAFAGGSPDSLDCMTEALILQPNPRLAQLGRRLRGDAGAQIERTTR
jgi:TPR repeat protein